MNNHLNKDLVCSIVFIELVNFALHSELEQANIKYSLNQILSLSLKEFARSDFNLWDKGDAIVIAYMATPLDVLDIVVEIQRGVWLHNNQNASSLLVRIGVHLGAMNVIKEANGQFKIAGKGVSEAQQIAQFAQINAIVVSPNYYAVSLPLPHSIAAQYLYSGLSVSGADAEYNAYELRLLTDGKGAMLKQNMNNSEENTIDDLSPVPAYQPVKARDSIMSILNWKYLLAITLIAAGIWMLVKLVSTPIEPKITLTSPTLIESEQSTNEILPASKPVSEKATAAAPAEPFNGLLPNESIEQLPEALVVTPEHKQVGNVNSSANLKKAEISPDNKPAKVKDATNIVHNNHSDEIGSGEKNKADTSLQKTTEAKAVSSKEPIKTEEIDKDNVKHNQLDKDESSESKLKQKSAWATFKESIKQGAPISCSQAEIALGQCR